MSNFNINSELNLNDQLKKKYENIKKKNNKSEQMLSDRTYIYNHNFLYVSGLVLGILSMGVFISKKYK
jgi:hypothetical protein